MNDAKRLTAINLSPATNFLLMLKSAFLNLPDKFKEAETDRREFPRILNLAGISSTADARFNQKIEWRKKT